jgi:uncharacterized tellurite resistance protein B-like protein
MLNYLKDLFDSSASNDNSTDNNRSHRLEIAACALLIEVAKADDEFSDEEKDRITEIMKNKFHLSESEVSSIFEESEESVRNSVSLYEFTDTLNQHLSNDEKYSVLKLLWQIAYADGNIDKYEDHYIKKISNNLHLYNKDRIAAKFEVKEMLGL